MQSLPANLSEAELQKLIKAKVAELDEKKYEGFEIFKTFLSPFRALAQQDAGKIGTAPLSLRSLKQDRFKNLAQKLGVWLLTQPGKDLPFQIRSVLYLARPLE